YLRPNTRIFAGDGRSFLMNTRKTWDIIHMTGIDTFLASSNGSFVMAENYLYTVEAVKSYFAHLSPQGVYTCVRWEFPERPRELLRVCSNALQALRELGVPDPTRHLVVTSFGSGQAMLMMQRSPYTEEQRTAIVDRAAAASEELIFVPGRDASGPTGRIYQTLARGYQNKRERRFLKAYEYDVSPVRDDRPFFYQYYRFSRLLEAARTGEILRATQQHGYWPFIVLAAVFVQGVVLVTLFILVPLLLWRRSGLVVRGAVPLAIYFAALGMAYIMIELALMQKFALLLGDPIYSIMIVLGSMLVFTRAGSFVSGRA